MAGEATDAEIIAASLDDAERFGEIFDRHYESIYKFVARRVDDASARDVAADVFVKAFNLRPRYDPTVPNSRPWLYGIARNMIRDHLRRRGRAAAAYVRFSSGAELAVRAPDEEAAARLALEQLRRALKRLKPRDAEAIVMFAVEGMDYAEIGEVLGIPEGTVKSSIFRARKKIGELVDTQRPTTGWGSDSRGDTT